MIGRFLKWLINIWIAVTGKVCRYSEYPWLKGPVSDQLEIGSKYYEVFAQQEGLEIRSPGNAGLLTDFRKAIPVDDACLSRLNPRIAAFYEHTKQYKLEVWSQWYRPYSAFAKLLIRALSTQMNQLNIPLYPLETSRGMSNDVLQLFDSGTRELKYACWLRRSILTGKVVYAGFYSVCHIKGLPFVKVNFPLPDGNVTVILRVTVLEDGSVKLLSDGKKIGDTGYYRVRRHTVESVKVKYIPIKESIHVFEDETGVLRTDHEFWFLGSRLLHLHYKIIDQ
jgi:hypothetical protein